MTSGDKKMIISVVMCEGMHDISFISKILCANGCSEYKEKVEDYPFPIDRQIKSNYSKNDIGDKIIGNGPDSPFVPKAVYTNEKKLIIFHNMNGDSDTKTRYKLIEQYQKNSIALQFANPSNITAFEFFLFYDADELGVAKRMDWIKDKFQSKYQIPDGEIGQARKVPLPDAESCKMTLGTYVFYDPADPEQKGTLENMLLALMRKENSDLFARAEDFLNSNVLEAERTKEYDSKQDKYAGGGKFKYLKSEISIAGQLQFSGMNNSVIILKSDYIKKHTILADDECIKIANLVLQ